MQNSLKRVLGGNENLMEQFEAGFLNERFALSEKGVRALLQILAVKNEAELGARAKELNEEASAE